MQFERFLEYLMAFSGALNASFPLKASILLYKLNVSNMFYLKKQYEPVHEISNNVIYATSKASDQPAYTHRLTRAVASRLNILL